MKNEKGMLYSHNKIDFTQEKMFFGTGKNTQRYDDMKYSWYDKNNNTQQGHDWAWDEITIKNDLLDYSEKLTDAQRYIIKRSLQRAIFLDSINGRGPIAVFGQVCNLPEVEADITTWQYFEVNKHSRTYTKHLRAFYPNPGEVFDESFTLDALQTSAQAIAGPYNAAYRNVINWIYKQQRDLEMSKEETQELLETFIMGWIEVNILEGIRFYPFFAGIWGINNGTKLMNELSGDLILICRDENEHLNLTQHTLKILKRNKDEGFTDTFLKLIPRIKQRFYDAYIEECEWIDELFSHGSYLGMSATIMKSYINYLIGRRMRAVGIEPDANNLGGILVLKNPIPWVDYYIYNDEEEKLPQQENVLNYITNGIKNDILDHTTMESVKKYIRVRNTL